MAASPVSSRVQRVRLFVPGFLLAWGLVVLALGWSATEVDTVVAFVVLSTALIAVTLHGQTKVAVPLGIVAIVGFPATLAFRAGAVGSGVELYLPPAMLGTVGMAATLVASGLLRNEIDRIEGELGARTAAIESMQQRNPATGAYRSGPGHEMLLNEVDRCARYARDCAIALLSVEDWPRGRDAQSDSERDLSIRELLDAYRDALRTTDRIIEDGDDFLILLTETSAQPAEIVAERLCTAAERVTGSAARAGVASFPHSAVTADELIEEARAALAFARTARVPVAGPTLLS